MKKLIAVLALGAFVAVARAEEPPHLDFVQKLRANHYPDLALEYLQKLAPTAPADMRPNIELEMARTQLDLARAEPDAAKKPALFAQARQKFEAFLKNNPNSAQASEAKLEITSLAVSQGKAQLQKAMSQASGASRRAEALKARAALDDAAKQLENGVKELDVKLVKYDEVKTDKERKEKAALEEAKLRAQMERGVILLDQAQTYLGNEGNEERAEIIKQARTALEKTASAADGHSAVHWQAKAWTGKCIYEDGDPPAARTRLEAIYKTPSSSANTPGIEAGRRLALYFLIQIVPFAQTQKVDPNREQYDLARTWIKSFPSDLNTPEGQHVRFMLGESCVNIAQTLAQDKNPNRATIAQYHAEAEKLFKDLEQSDNEYSDRARLQYANVVFTRTGGEKTPIKNLTSFDACYIRALFEAAQMERDAKTIKNAADLEKKHKERNQNIVAALELGLKYADNKRTRLSEKDVDTATAMLVYADLTGGKYKDAIQLGEKLVYDKARAPQAPTVAMYTLQAYGQILGPDGNLTEDEEKKYRKQLIGDEKTEGLAKFVADRWPNDSAGHLAHFQMGLLLIRDKNYPEAVEELAKINPTTFGAAIHSQYHLASTAFQVAKDRAAEKDKAAGAKREELAKEEQAYKERAVKALESLPELPAGADAATNQIYIYAKVLLGQHLYTQKKYAEMEKLAEPLLKRLPAMQFVDDAAREQAKASLTLLTLYAAYGKADEEFTAGQPAKARESVDKIVEQFKAGSLPELTKDPQLRGGILGLALRSSLQEGKLDRAKEILKVIQDAADNPKEGGVRAILPFLAKIMKDEITALRAKNDKAALNKATAGFTAFLDELAKGQGDNSAESRRVLAQAYGDLDQHAKVIDLASKIEAPKDDGDQRTVQNYRAARVLLMRAYRLNNQLDDAEKVLKEAWASWGKNNIDVQFERIHLLDAHNKHGSAATEWNKLVKQLQPRLKEPDIKPRYFECYFYLVRSLYRHGVQAKEPKYVKQAAGMAAKLEKAWPDFGGEASKARFEELLAKEKEFSAQYKQQKDGK
jgi:hypothetical protein